MLQQCLPLAVLKHAENDKELMELCLVATVLTACGIETSFSSLKPIEAFKLLQQCLPLAVLKLINILARHTNTVCRRLQQCLPLAVLKR